MSGLRRNLAMILRHVLLLGVPLPLTTRYPLTDADQQGK